MSRDIADEHLAVVAASHYRADTLGQLWHGAATPSTIAEETDNRISHVSRALSALRDAGLVELLVPEETKKGRVYGITEAGEAVVRRLDITSDEARHYER